MLKQILHLFDRLLRRATDRLPRAAHTPARARPGLLRAEFECLESRSMLSLATADEGFALKPDIGWLPTPDYGDISILPSRPIDDGARPWPPGYPSLPPHPYEPYVPAPPASEFPDNADVGGFTEIDNSDKSDPGILVGPANDRIMREVQQMLDALLYVPRVHDPAGPTMPERISLSTQNTVSAAGISSGRLDELHEGGMIALAHDAVILHSPPSDLASHDDIDAWLNVPIRMDSAPGKFQAFEVSTSEAPPPPEALPINEAMLLTPRISPAGLTPPAASESTSQVSLPRENTAAIEQAISETIDDSASSPAAPPEQNDKNSAARPAAAAAIFLFLAVRAARAARTTDATEPHSQTTSTLSRPARPNR